MFVLFAVATTLWAAVVVRARASVHRVHHLMTALAAAKTATLLSEAGMYHYLRATGHPDGWNIAFYIFTFVRGLLFFSVCWAFCTRPPLGRVWPALMTAPPASDARNFGQILPLLQWLQRAADMLAAREQLIACMMSWWQVVVLVGTGWSYMKPLLAKREKSILMFVIPLQACRLLNSISPGLHTRHTCSFAECWL